MQAQGIDIHCGTDVMQLERAADGIRAITTDGAEETYDMVMYATGRRPNTDGLGLEALGVALGRQGQITVDRFSQTAVPSIYAVGDVTGPDQPHASRDPRGACLCRYRLRCPPHRL